MPVSPMSTRRRNLIHPTAIVSPEASLDGSVEVGPYSVIGPQVKIGKGTRVMGHVHIEGDTEIGERCQIFSGAMLGGLAQIRGSKPVRSALRLGHDNVIREYVTIHVGMKDGSKTVMGDRNLLMVNAHVAHDCVLGSDTVISNCAALAGHVQIEDRVVLGGFVGVHQFVRIGKLSMVGGLSKVTQDVAPFSVYDGHPASFRGVNAVGLKRAGYTSSQRTQIKKALMLFLGQRVNLSGAISKAEKQFKGNSDVEALLKFIRNSKRGVGRVSPAPSAEEEI
jgi:UDP-N-acetylglucosamine acyltransferase